MLDTTLDRRTALKVSALAGGGMALSVVIPVDAATRGPAAAG